MAKPITGINYMVRCPICNSKTKIVCYSDGLIIYRCNNKYCKNKIIRKDIQNGNNSK